MVKLLRLQSDAGVLNFSNSLQDNLILKPKSKIGLLNVAWEKELKTLLVNDSNDKVTVSFGGDIIEFTLPHGTWDSTNIEIFRKTVSNNFNNALSIDIPAAIGVEMKVEINDDNKLNFRAHQQLLRAFWADNNIPEDNYVNYGLDRDENGIIRKNEQNTHFDSAIYGINESYFFKSNEGCGVFRVQIKNLENSGADTGAYIGFSILNGAYDSDFSFDTSKITFGIHVKKLGETYRYIKAVDGTPEGPTVFNPTPSTPFHSNIDDIMEIAVSNGKVVGTVYSDSTSKVLFNEEYTGGHELYPIIAIANPSVTLSTIKYTPRDLGQINLSSTFSSDDTSAPQQSIIPIKQEIEFETLEVASFLGFNQKSKSMSNKASEMNISSDFSLVYYDKSEAYIAELMNLNCQSYDFSEKKEKRRNIIALVQNHRDSDKSDVIFNTDNPVMIDLNNDMDILLRNLQMRILNTNEEQVQIDGRANAILLVE